ncbi:MAG TPA: hypothetical protein VNJ71_09490 [Gemmatimonadales bacterium]|nr:hypothetical protein [Gemmatimonadales bacterium]
MLVEEVERIVSLADTKQRRSTAYWDRLFGKLDSLKPQGLDFIVEKVPPFDLSLRRRARGAGRPGPR